MKLRNIISLNEFNSSVDVAPPKPPRRRGGGGGDDDDDESTLYPYYYEWYRYHELGQHSYMFDEVIRDEAWRTKVSQAKTNAKAFYDYLWKEYEVIHNMHKAAINDEIIEFIDKYNKSVEELDRKRQLEQEIDDINNLHEEKIAGITVRYRLQKPEEAAVRKFMKYGESEESARRKLFLVDKILFTGTDEEPTKEDIAQHYDWLSPEAIEEKYDQMWTSWVHRVYNPFFTKHIEPLIVKNNWRLWSY